MMNPEADFWLLMAALGGVAAPLVYVVARRTGIMAWVDLIWTTGMGLGALAYFFLRDFESPVRAGVVLVIVLLWSGRLTAYLLKDRIVKGREDPRYEHLVRHWGRRANRNFFFLFLVQVPFVLLFLVPITTAMSNPAAFGRPSDGLALLLAVAALAGEFLADRQLAAFRADPAQCRGVCRRGLWRYSRHPNYFFEWLHWWAYVALALGAPGWAWSLLGPAAMYLFLRFLTGVPHAERSSLARRGEAYRLYQETTNAFFPWPPRESQS